MKAGQVYKSCLGSDYVVINDYGILRPLILKSHNMYMEMNSDRWHGIDVDEAEDKHGFYTGDVLIAETFEEYVVGGGLATTPNREYQK